MKNAHDIFGNQFGNFAENAIFYGNQAKWMILCRKKHNWGVISKWSKNLESDQADAAEVEFETVVW